MKIHIHYLLSWSIVWNSQKVGLEIQIGGSSDETAFLMLEQIKTLGLLGWNECILHGNKTFILGDQGRML